jgi:hypothetical protein
VVELTLDDEPVVLGSKLRILVASELSRKPDVASKTGITLFRDPWMTLAMAGLIDSGDHAGERPDRCEVRETVGVTETTEDPAGKYWSDPGSGSDDPLRICVAVELGNALIETVDLGIELADHPHL